MAHRIFPHGLPEQLSNGVWRVRGGLVFPLHRNMIVLRMPSGELLLHSAVAMDDAGLKALGELGRPAYVVAPHHQHAMDAPFYAERYPGLKVLTPTVHREAVAAKSPGTLAMEDVLPGLGFTLHATPASRVLEYVLEWPLPSGGRMLIVNDALGSSDMTDKSKLLGRYVLGALGTPHDRLGIARIYRLSNVKDLAAHKAFIEHLADIPDLRLLTVSHGEPVKGDVAAALRAAAA